MGALDVAPLTWVAGALVTAAQLNAELRDKFTALQAPWLPYTTAWSQDNGTALAIADGTIVARYQQIGKTVNVRITLTRGASTNTGSAGYYRFTLPVYAASSNHVGSGVVYRGSGPLACTVGMSSTNFIYLNLASSATGARVGYAVPATGWTTGDWFTLCLTYEAQ